MQATSAASSFSRQESPGVSLNALRRANYERAGKALDVDLVDQPRLAETPEVGARIAAWYWQSRDLNACANRGDFITITRRINGRLNGLADREAYHTRAKKVLGLG